VADGQYPILSLNALFENFSVAQLKALPFRAASKGTFNMATKSAVVIDNGTKKSRDKF
jgi:hypothetical protein